MPATVRERLNTAVVNEPGCPMQTRGRSIRTAEETQRCAVVTARGML